MSDGYIMGDAKSARRLREARRETVATEATLRQRIQELEDALRWYGDSDNYAGMSMGPEWTNLVELDAGNRARVVLYGKPDEDVG